MVFAPPVIVVWLFFLSGFFINLNSTISDYSYGDISWWLQSEHNFVNGRPFQESIVSWAQYKEIGVIRNPDAYVNILANHSNITSILIAAPFYFVKPTIYTLYIIVIALNYFALAYFSFRIVQHLSPKQVWIKTLLVFSLFLAGSFLRVIQYKAHPILFSAPLIFGAYYMFLKKRLAWFTLLTLAIILISEDAAMFVISFSLYLLIFEEHARRYAIVASSMAFAWLAAVIYFIQPAARAHMVMSTGSLSGGLLKSFFSKGISLGILLGRLTEYKEIFLFLPAFLIVLILVKRRPDTKTGWKIAGLIFLAPIVHWGISLMFGAGHHIAPIVYMTYLALLLFVGYSDQVYDFADLALSPRVLLASVTVIFLATNTLIMWHNVPVYLQPRLFRMAGFSAKSQEVEEDLAEISSNRYFIKTVSRIPKTNSLSFVGNKTVQAFLVERSDVWSFPDYYAQSDFVAIQKDARHVLVRFNSSAENIDKAVTNSSEDLPISPKMCDRFLAELVRIRRTHRVALNNNKILLLEKLDKRRLPMPEYTRGFGFL